MKLTKTEIIKVFSRLRNAEEKEQFLKDNHIPFTHDSFYNLIIWTEDGVLELLPKRKGE